MTKKKSKSKKSKTKMSKTGLVVAGLATAAVVGVGVFLVSGTASAKKAKPSKSKGAGSANPSRGSGTSRIPGAGGADAGGSAGPGGALPSGGGKGRGKTKPGGTRPKADPKSNDDAPAKTEPKGFWWGDRSKVPADFDYQSNRIWISADRTAAAAGFGFFLDGLDAAGERVTWDEKGLSFMVADGSVRTPTEDRDHREDPPPNLRAVLEAKNPETGKPRHDSVFSWVGAYYGTGISPLEAATSRGVDLLQDMVDEASVLSGGSRGAIDLNGPLRDFYGYALRRLEMGREAIYGSGFAWGKGEDAVG